MASSKDNGLPFAAPNDGSKADPNRAAPKAGSGGGPGAVMERKSPQNTSHADDAATHDKGQGSDFPEADPPAVRKPFIGTVAGNNQRKPFNVKTQTGEK